MAAKKKTVMCAGKRDIFGEMMAGVEEMKEHREEKITLRSYKHEPIVLPQVNAQAILEWRQHLNISRGVLAQKLLVNERTLEKWEQGRAKPNRQAAALILLSRTYPDMFDRLERLSA